MSGFNMKEAMGLGTETIDQSVLGMPFIQIVQKGSPEFDETHKDYAKKKIEGCKPGSVFFVPARTVLAQPITAIPLAVRPLYTEWKPRGQGGGFVGNRELTITTDRNYKKGTPNTPDEYKEWLGENELKLTIYVSVKFLHGTEWKRGIISFSATQLKAGRLWQKQLLTLRYPDMPNEVPPIFASQWKLTSKAESNDKGGWYGWDINLDRLLDPGTDQQLLEDSFKVFKEEQIKLGSTAPAEALTAGSSNRPAKDDGDVPF